MKKAWMSWSTGKDSACALAALKRDPELRVEGLLTTLNDSVSRVAIHGVPEELLDLQAQALGLPLKKVRLPDPCSNAIYESKMSDAVAEARTQGISVMGFGDLFLGDIRTYREQKLAGSGITPLFPLWGIPTDRLAWHMMQSGIRAVVSCVDLKRLPPTFAGRTFDKAFLKDLPRDVDPCGENGEFHTFVYDTPYFEGPLPIEVAGVVQCGDIAYADLRRA